MYFSDIAEPLIKEKKASERQRNLPATLRATTSRAALIKNQVAQHHSIPIEIESYENIAGRVRASNQRAYRKLLELADVKVLKNIYELLSIINSRNIGLLRSIIRHIDAEASNTSTIDKIKSETKEFLLKKENHSLKKNDELLSLGKQAIRRTLSKDTGAYIHYIKEIGPSGIYAASASERLAEREIIDKLRNEITNACDDKIAYWKKSLDIECRKEHLARVVENIQKQSCNGSIGLYTSVTLKNKIKEMASKLNISMNDLACKLAQKGVSDITENVLYRYDRYFHDLLRKFDENHTDKGEKVKWVVRCDKPTHARIIHLANTEEISSAKALERILENYVDM